MSFRVALLTMLIPCMMKSVPSDIAKSAIGGTYSTSILTVSVNYLSLHTYQNHSNIPPNSKKHFKPEPQSQIFTGIVEWEYKPGSWDCDVPNCDHFALYDDATRNNYELDDARAALPYEGKKVKVTGVLNSKNGTIHLISIEAVKKFADPVQP